MAEKNQYVNLEDILTKSAEVLTALKLGEIECEKLGTLPVTAIDSDEFKEIKNDCTKMVPNGSGGMRPEVDDDKMMIRVLITAVDKDKRSNFSFADKKLLNHLGVLTAEGAVKRLLSPGEILNCAADVQDLSGFGRKAKKEQEETVKNS